MLRCAGLSGRTRHQSRLRPPEPRCRGKQPDESGLGSVPLQEDGTLKMEIAFHLGDKAIFRTKREGSPPPC